MTITSAGPDLVVDGENVTGPPMHGLDACPVCGQAGAQEWLWAPDRLHGRHDPYTLVRCPQCSLVWLKNPPKPEEMHLHYTDAYHRLISAGGENSPNRWRHRKVALAPYKRSGALLDLGCSSGAFLESMKGGAWELYGIEMSGETARAAQDKSGAEVFVGDILEARFAPESFDVITCFDVLEHLYEPRRVMAKIGEWLKPGGIFYVLVPNIDSSEARVFGTYWHGLEAPRHLFHYSPASLEFLAETAGLEPVSLETRRNPAVGTSLRYVWDDAFEAVGIRRTPAAYLKSPSLPWRAARKLVRVTVLRALLAMAPLVGGGESIHAIFRKE
ncbi:MAG TPA: class I SAM-dependent methyltransferase [Candidatus Eisenbacteria bacterium]|nr:class I SAM-dependent methyltransferase [Candidatus Eisenbacteria bacterium]